MTRKIFPIILLFFIVDGFISHLEAQDDVPTHAADGEYLREWLVLGPFFPDDLDKDFLAGVGGEANVNPKAGDTVTTADGATLTWKRYKSQ
jgi:hypothetical protein